LQQRRACGRRALQPTSSEQPHGRDEATDARGELYIADDGNLAGDYNRNSFGERGLRDRLLRS
jgi:hypothetical protein